MGLVLCRSVASIWIVGVVAAMGAALLAVQNVHGQDTRFVCTMFIGYSQTDNWIGPAANTMNAGGQDRVQLLWNPGGAAIRWAGNDPAFGPNYSGWSNPIQSPCAQSSSAPDRLILDITHYNYLDVDCPGTDLDGFTCSPDGVGFMEHQIRDFVTQARTRYPSAANNIVIQPVVGGPNHTTCANRSAPEHGVVRASYNHPQIHEAILRVVADPGMNVTMGYDATLTNCSGYQDWEGHLKRPAQNDVGTRIGTYYRDLGSGQ
jgi:hypothetical protein